MVFGVDRFGLREKNNEYHLCA